MKSKHLQLKIDTDDLVIDDHSVLKPTYEKWTQTYYSTGDMNYACEQAGLEPSRAMKLRNSPRIRARLREMATQSLEDLKERRGQLVQFLMQVVTANITDYVDSDSYAVKPGLDREAAFAVKSIKPTKYGTQLELYDRIKAVELLAEISGLKVDKVDITSGGMPIKQTPVSITFEVATAPKLVEAEVVKDNDVPIEVEVSPSASEEVDPNDVTNVAVE